MPFHSLRVNTIVGVIWILLTSTVHAQNRPIPEGRVAPRAMAPLAEWRIENQPLLRLGPESGDRWKEFDRVIGLLRLDDGTIVVGNAGTSELRFFDKAGVFLGKVGRPGAGPAEFRQLRLLTRDRGDIVATDGGGRIIRFSASRKHLGTTPAFRGGVPSLMGFLRDGAALYLETHPFNQMARSGIVTIFGSIHRVEPSGEVQTILSQDPISAMQGTKNGAQPLVFQERMLRTITPTGHCSAKNTRFVVRCFDGHGKATIVIDLQRPPIPVTSEMKKAFLRAIVATPGPSEVTGEPRQRLDPLFASEFPLLARLRASVDGELWVEAFSMDLALLGAGHTLTTSTPTKWTVFSADGELLATIQLPRRFRPFEIGRDYILGVERDADDAEIATLFRIRR